MKKHIFGLPLVYFTPLLFICVLGIIFGSFFDLSLSKSIVNQSSSWGRFVESYGMIFGYEFITLAGVLLFKGLKDSQRLPLRLLGVFLLVLSCVVTIYFVADQIKDTKEAIKTFGYSQNLIVAYIIAIIITAILLTFSLFIVESEDKEYMIRIAIIIIFVMLAQSLFIKLIKNVNCRPRYRNLSGSDFRGWWVFTPFEYSDDLHKSWPSGHTATAACTILAPLLSRVLKFKFKNCSLLLLLFSYFYTIVIAFSRIYYGAHYLSDVSFGALITLLFSLLAMFVVERVYIHKKN